MTATIEHSGDESTASRLPHRSFRPRDLVNQVVIQGLAVSPDGGSVVYGRRTVEENRYARRLWRVEFVGGRPEQLTSAKCNDTRPRLSPDGASLLFTSDRSGKPQLWVTSIKGGEPWQLTDLPEGANGGEWSPDGKRVLFIAPSGEKRFMVGSPDDPIARQIRDYTWRLNGKGYRDEFNSVWVVDPSGGAPVRMTAPSYDAGPACWSADAKNIVFLADLRDEAAVTPYKQLWGLPSRSLNETPMQVASLPGAIHNLAWAPFPQLAFLGNRLPNTPGWANVNLFVVDNGQARQLAEDQDLDLCVRTYGDFMDDHLVYEAPLVWRDEGHAVALVSRRGASHPYSFGVDGSVDALAENDVVCHTIAAGGGRVAVVASGAGAADVFAVEDGQLRRMPAEGGKWFGPFERPLEPIQIPSPEGHTIAGWLYRAHSSSGPGPLVIEVHGGPNLSFGPSPWLEMIALCDAGIHVIAANTIGSGGYGEDYARAVNQWGEEDGDILRLVEWAVEEGIADRDRIGIMGLSQGGFMTNWMLGQHPGIFAAAVSENPVTDFLAEYASSDAGIEVVRRAVGTDRPWENLDALLERSPYTKIHLNQAPLLLLQCEQDLRCPPGQSEMVFTILRSLGREVEMVRYPAESHVMLMNGRPDRRVDRLGRIVGWFQKYLARGVVAYEPGAPTDDS